MDKVELGARLKITSRFLVPTLLRGHEPKATDEVNAEQDAPASDWRRKSVAVVHAAGLFSAW